MSRNSIHRNRFVWIIAFVIIALFVSNCCNERQSTEENMPISTQAPSSKEVTYNDLQLFYLSLNSGLAFDDIIKSLESYNFIYDDSGSNSSCQVRIGYDADVIKRYHAANGERIEIAYPLIRKNTGESAHPYLEYFVYKLDANRCYTLIQLFPIDGYTSSYWNHKEIGTYVREWPPRDGIDEYTMFDSVEEAMKYIIVNAYR